MPERAQHTIVRYLISQGVTALALPPCLAGLMIAANTGGLRTLIASSSSPEIATAVLIAGATTTLGPLIFATGVALLATED